jgi:hypothetical protein
MHIQKIPVGIGLLLVTGGQRVFAAIGLRKIEPRPNTQ